DPPWRRKQKLDGNCCAGEDRADQQDEERGGPVADVEGGKVQAARPALRRETDPAGKQGALAAARALPAQRCSGQVHGTSRGSARPSRPRRRWKRTGTARRRRRNASTRPPPRSRNAAWG